MYIAGIRNKLFVQPVETGLRCLHRQRICVCNIKSVNNMLMYLRKRSMGIFLVVKEKAGQGTFSEKR